MMEIKAQKIKKTFVNEDEKMKEKLTWSWHEEWQMHYNTFKTTEAKYYTVDFSTGKKYIYIIENWCLWVVVRQHVVGKYPGNKMKAKKDLRKGTVQDWLNIVHG